MSDTLVLPTPHATHVFFGGSCLGCCRGTSAVGVEDACPEPYDPGQCSFCDGAGTVDGERCVCSYFRGKYTTSTTPVVLDLTSRSTGIAAPTDEAVRRVLLEEERLRLPDDPEAVARALAALEPPRRRPKPSKAAMLFGIAAAMGVPLPSFKRRERKVDPPYNGPRVVHVETKGPAKLSRRERKALKGGR